MTNELKLYLVKFYFIVSENYSPRTAFCLELQHFWYSSTTLFWWISLWDPRQLNSFSRTLSSFIASAFLAVATVDSGFQELQWFGNSVAGLATIKSTAWLSALFKIRRKLGMLWLVTHQWTNLGKRFLTWRSIWATVLII